MSGLRTLGAALNGAETMASTRESMQAHFREQASICTEYGSPFTGEVIARLGADFDTGGPVADLVGAWTGHPRADAVSLRLCGALHAAALTGRDPELTAEYPERRSDWQIDRVWPIARAFLAREKTWVAEFIRSAPQTNEVRRSIALLTGFLAFANTYDGPIDTLEIGASAGLNLYWDRFSYRTASWSWGASGGVTIDCAWSGPPPPLEHALTVRTRAACDLNPLDITDALRRLHLRSYIWPDQADRLARFDAAAKLAIAHDVRVERADAAEWLAQRLATRAPDAATIVYHSVFLQYPTPAGRDAIRDAIHAAGERATASAPVAWLRLEPEAVLGGPRESMRFLVDLVTWPGAARRTLAVTDGHVRAIEALPALVL